MQLNIALKEWSATIDALVSGDQLFLLRKGGIRETNRHFELPHRRFLLYPTHFHEADLLLKPKFMHLVDSKDSVARETVLFKAFAEVTDVLSVSNADALYALSELHIWSEEFVTKRIAWKPRHAADLIVLKTYTLSSPIRMPVEPHHKGCKSLRSNRPPKLMAPNPQYPNQNGWNARKELDSCFREPPRNPFWQYEASTSQIYRSGTL